MPSLIATCAPESSSAAHNELRRVAAAAALETWIEDGVALVAAPDPAAFAEALVASPPVFVRHLAPVDLTVPLTGSPADITRLAQVIRETYLPRIATNLAQDQPWQPHAVQVRLSNRAVHPYTRYALAEPLREMLAQFGPEDVRHPQQVLAVYCTAEQAYIGLWPTARCLSDWPGGERRFARTSAQISRSEFKLLEALEAFKLVLPSHGCALDLGAAPGGWTRLLVERGLTVVAVDPAALDVRVAALSQVEQWHGRAEAFLAGNSDWFDLVVNDMRLDARDSARLMLRAAEHLHPGSLALMTLKLPQAKIEPVYHQARRIFAEAYTIIGARQLFHNRSEITLVGRR
jgi:23S rRNA (cytidine2498-2'-O)-methyltransferase